MSMDMGPTARIGVSVVLLVLAAGAGCASVGKSTGGIPNFATVEDGLYRGGQPSELGFKELSRRGVMTVINLRDDAWPNEQKLVEQAGMQYVRIPSNAAVVEPAKIDMFLTQVTTAPRPIFVHCRQGRDRTGLEIAMYRIAVEGWSRQDAIAELYAHGYNWALFPGIERHLRTAPLAASRNVAAAE